MPNANILQCHVCNFPLLFCWPSFFFWWRAMNILAEMKSTLGLNDCKLLCINSSTEADGADAENSWLPYVSTENYFRLNCISVYVVQPICNLVTVFSWLNYRNLMVCTTKTELVGLTRMIWMRYCPIWWISCHLLIRLLGHIECHETIVQHFVAPNDSSVPW